MPTTESLVIGLGDGVSLLPGLLGDFRPNLNLTFPTTSDAALLIDLDAGAVDAILVHHLPAQRDDLWFNPVALDGIVLIAHPNSRFEDVTLDFAQALFSGAEPGIDLVIADEGAGMRVLFDRFVMGERRVSINAEIRPNAQAIIDAVSSKPNAIGFVTSGALPPDAAVHILSIEGVLPTPTTLGTQEYPLTMPVYWVSAVEPVGELRGVLGFLQSVEAQGALGVVFGRIR